MNATHQNCVSILCHNDGDLTLTKEQSAAFYGVGQIAGLCPICLRPPRAIRPTNVAAQPSKKTAPYGARLLEDIPERVDGNYE